MTSKAKNSPTSYKSLAASIGRNTVFGVLSSFSQVATRLVTVPIVIHHLGLGGYGIWNIIMVTAAYMRFGTVGVKNAFQKYVAEATGNKDYEKANKLLSTGFVVMLILSVAGLIPVAHYSNAIARAAGVPSNFLSSAAGAISLLAWMMVLSNVGAAFEAIVMGGHRIDLVRKFNTALTIAEAVAIVVVIHFGQGLLAMAAVMGISELLFVIACYFAAKRIVPDIRLSTSSVTASVLYELLRFAGSYQLISLLDILYASIMPFVMLRFFGASSAGLYAIVTRVVTSAAVLQEAFLLPVLSGGTMVYASGSAERMRNLLSKAFKVTTALSIFPLGFIAVFGTTIASAWTGETDPSLGAAFLLVCLSALFRAYSLLSFVLYRVSGRAVLDNLRQVLRILVLSSVVFFAPRFGFEGVLAGLALAELSGMAFMLFALARTFKGFRVQSLLPDTLRILTAAVFILGAGILAYYIPIPDRYGLRVTSTLKLLQVSVACLLIAWPTLVRTGSVNASEGRALLGAFLHRTSSSTPV